MLINSHLDYIPSSCGDFSKEQMSLRRVLSTGYYYNERYQGKWDEICFWTTFGV